MPMGLPLPSLLSLRQRQTDKEKKRSMSTDWRTGKVSAWVFSAGGCAHNGVKTCHRTTPPPAQGIQRVFIVFKATR